MMYATNQKLVCLRSVTGGKKQTRTSAMYGTITSEECLSLGDDTDTRVIGVVMVDPASKKYVVKTASGFSNLQEWL